MALKSGDPVRKCASFNGVLSLSNFSNGVESQNVEFKSNWRDEYLKVIYAFANADGGRAN
ncbi:MAG: hypothetical protein M0Z64_03130 [Nitrospiraceae bacterium]|nr:hypothetical protein [Nitrospiraceae bacterium]